MKKILIAISIVLVGCQPQQQGELKLELLNKEVICINADDKDISNNKFYDSLSKNILSYRLTNNSNKKYLIVLNENALTTLENDAYMDIKTSDKIKLGNQIAFNLYSNDSILSGESTLTMGNTQNFTSSFLNPCDTIFLDASKKKKLYGSKHITIDYKDILEKSFVLHPKEVKYFTSIVNLPFRSSNGNWYSRVNKHTNKASLTLVSNAKKTEAMLSDNQRKELKINEYEIFDGVLESNKVRVKLIPISKQ